MIRSGEKKEACPVRHKPARRWVYQEHYKLNDDQRYEIIDGALLMPRAPDTVHQSWNGELFALLRAYVLQHKLGRVLMPPVDVVLDPENTVQEDRTF